MYYSKIFIKRLLRAHARPLRLFPASPAFFPSSFCTSSASGARYAIAASAPASHSSASCSAGATPRLCPLRPPGFEPGSLAWKAKILPLDYGRSKRKGGASPLLCLRAHISGLKANLFMVIITPFHFALSLFTRTPYAWGSVFLICLQKKIKTPSSFVFIPKPGNPFRHPARMKAI